MKNTILFSFALLFLLNACKPAIEDPGYNKGEINPERFVMIGGGHAAGYMDDALYHEGQINSVANMIAGQLKLVGLSDFNQPLVNPASDGIGLSGLSKLYLNYKTDCKGTTSLSPVRVATSGDQTIFNDNLYNSSALFGNFGIPGLKLSEVNSANYAASNAYFNRMASSATTSVLQDAVASNPTFFSVFSGIEDVMNYAKSGGTSPLPDPTDFQSNYSSLIQSLSANGAKGVVGLIPDVSEMPYFTTIPWNGLALDSATNVTLNLIFNLYGFYFNVGQNPFMMDDAASTFGFRQILEGELLLLSLPLDSVKCNQMGVLFPIRDEFILDMGEQSELRTKIEQYNTVIRNIASQYNLAVAETDNFFHKLYESFIYNGVTLSSKFVSGGVYSLDGIHLNPRGNALLANEFIRAINSKFNSKIPELNAGAYRSILFPN
jgi:hypothetical protein